MDKAYGAGDSSIGFAIKFYARNFSQDLCRSFIYEVIAFFVGTPLCYGDVPFVLVVSPYCSEGGTLVRVVWVSLGGRGCD